MSKPLKNPQNFCIILRLGCTSCPSTSIFYILNSTFHLMPNTKSAIKALRQNVRRRGVNLKALETIRKTTKLVRKATSKADGTKALAAAFAALDKAAKKNVIHRNNASRHKSRLTKLVSKMK